MNAPLLLMPPPLVVCCGVGRDSTAMLVGLWLRGQRPDLILFADVGAEREATYAYLRDVLNPWLASVGFPLVTVVKYAAKNFKHWPPYSSIEENCLTNGTLPSIAYGGHACSSKWKIAPQDAFIRTWRPAIDAWARGLRVVDVPNEAAMSPELLAIWQAHCRDEADYRATVEAERRMGA